MALLGYSQEEKKSQLQVQRGKILRELEDNKRILNELKKDKSNSLAVLQALENKVKSRQALIENYQKSVTQLNTNMSSTELEITQYQKNLERLKKDYAQMIKYAYVHRTSLNILSYLFAVDNYQEAFRKLGHLKKYRQVRNQQVAQILNSQQVLLSKIAYLDRQINSKKTLINAEEDQKSKLENERQEKAVVYKDLKGQEKEIRAKIAKQQADARKLQNQIQYLIKKEMEANAARIRAEKERQRKLAAQQEAERKRKLEQARIAREKAEAEKRRIEEERREAERQAQLAREAELKRQQEEARLKEIENERERRRKEQRMARAKQAAEEEYKRKQAELAKIRQDEQAAQAKLAQAKKNERVNEQTLSAPVNSQFSDFASARGNLNRPVSGRIVGRFGTQPHPVFPNLKIENNGIDIYSSHGSPVHAAFDGKVSSIMPTPGGQGSTILISHGEYFTVYTNLGSIKVGNGSKVRRGQIIGAVGSDDEGNPVINFQVWKSTGSSSYKLNPADWVRY